MLDHHERELKSCLKQMFLAITVPVLICFRRKKIYSKVSEKQSLGDNSVETRTDRDCVSQCERERDRGHTGVLINSSR